MMRTASRTAAAREQDGVSGCTSPHCIPAAEASPVVGSRLFPGIIAIRELKPSVVQAFVLPDCFRSERFFSINR